MTCDGVLMVLCGLPGSGKSHLAKCFQQKIYDGTFKHDNIKSKLMGYIIEYDKLMPVSKEKQLIECSNDPDNQNRSAWKAYRECIVKAVDRFITYSRSEMADTENEVDQLFDEIKAQNSMCESSSKTNCKSVFIIDDNMYLISMRQPYYQLAKKYLYGFCEVLVVCDWNNIRNDEREIKVNKQTMEQMLKKFEPPQSSSTRLTFTIRNNDDNYETCWYELQSLINKCFENPIKIVDESENQEASRKICLTNIVHKTDSVLRILISEIMSIEKGKINKDEMKVLGKKLNEERINILENVRNGGIKFPKLISNEIENGNFENILPTFKQFLKSYFSYK